MKKSSAKKPKKATPKKQPKKVVSVKRPAKPAPKKQQAVVKKILEVVGISPTIIPDPILNHPVLVTPLPVKDVVSFGDMPFEAQARLIFSTFPADENEIIGTTNNSGPRDVTVPPSAKKS